MAIAKSEWAKNVSELINVTYSCAKFPEIYALINGDSALHFSSDHKEDMVLSSRHSNLRKTFTNYRIIR